MGPLQARHSSSSARRWFRIAERPLRSPLAQERGEGFPTDRLFLAVEPRVLEISDGVDAHSGSPDGKRRAFNPGMVGVDDG